MSAVRESSERMAAARLGFWTAVVTAVLTAATFATAFATPPRSGPNCTFEECVGAPYTDIGAYFPRDYYWMFPATVLVFVVLALVICVHSVAAPSKRPFTLMAIALAAGAAAIISVDYFIQLTVIQPSIRLGETDGLSLWSQYNPHGVFIALEAIGYLLIAAALAFMAPAFGGRGVERALRWLFVFAGVSSLAALVGLYAAYGHEVEYRFEIAVISIDWIALILGGVLLAFFFRRFASDT